MIVIVMLVGMVMTEGNKGGEATVGVGLYEGRGTPARNMIIVVVVSVPLNRT